MSLKCVNLESSLRIATDGTFHPCCVAKQSQFRDESGRLMNIQTHTFEEAFMSPTLQELRKAFEEGKKHPICEICWKEEEIGEKSKRIRDNLKVDGNNEVNKPYLLEINLGNICNLACRMCNLGASVNWKAEHNLARSIEYPNSKPFNKHDLDYEANKYSAPFRDESAIWQEIRDNLKYVKFLDLYGGEPMLMKKQWDILKKSIEDGHAQFQSVHFNTNGTLFKQEYVEILKQFQHADISFSIDGTDKGFDYVRYPAKWPKTEATMEKWLEATKEYNNFEFSICFTHQIFNILDFKSISHWSEAHNIRIYKNPLFYPKYFDSSIIPEEAKVKIEKIIDNMEMSDKTRKEYSTLINHMKSYKHNPKEFKNFFKINVELDKRRNQSFKSTYPELHSILFSSYNESVLI